MPYDLTPADRKLIDAIHKDVTTANMARIRKIHEGQLARHQQRREALQTQLDTLDRSIALRAAMLDRLDELQDRGI